MALPVLTTFSATGSTQTYTVPSGVEAVELDVRGAAGGGSDNPGGDGGRVVGRITTTPGETLTITVGTQGGSPSAGWPSGGSGANGPDERPSGGGGGHSDVRQGGSSFSDVVAVAGGGGGGSTAVGTRGGDGGADVGEDAPDTSDSFGGDGGSQTSGGGSGASQPDGGDGTYEDDGTQNPDAAASGGGGGGWYGGGAGTTATPVNDTAYAAGGGGGSNRTNPLATVSTNARGDQSGDGEVIIRDATPETPTNVTQSVVGDTEITVSWDSVVADEYEVQVAEDGGAYRAITTVPASTTAITYTATPETNSHTFRVRSINTEFGLVSGYATTATVRTEPGNLSVTGVDRDEITVAWDAAQDADGYEVTLSPVRALPRGGALTLARGETRTATRRGRTQTVAAGTTQRTLAVDELGRNKIDVQAVYSGGQDSQVESARATTPRVLITETQATEVSLRWGYDLLFTNESFAVYRTNLSVDGAPEREVAAVSPFRRTARDASAPPERTLQYRVAGDDAGAPTTDTLVVAAGTTETVTSSQTVTAVVVEQTGAVEIDNGAELGLTEDIAQ